MDHTTPQSALNTPVSVTTADAIPASDWPGGLPLLRGRRIALRELRMSDAPALRATLATEEVSRFISQPPTTIAGFERFIAWTLRQRAAGTLACFAVTAAGSDTAIGIFQLRQLSNGFEICEWGFAIGSSFWGTGVFQESAELVLAFAFEALHVQRLEARATVLNGRGNGALMKLGAVREGILRNALQRDGLAFDQALYAILKEDWRTNRGRIPVATSTHVH